MCVLGSQILAVWLPFFLLFARFCGVIKRGDNVDIVDIVDKTSAPIFADKRTPKFNF